MCSFLSHWHLIGRYKLKCAKNTCLFLVVLSCLEIPKGRPAWSDITCGCDGRNHLIGLDVEHNYLLQKTKWKHGLVESVLDIENTSRNSERLEFRSWNLQHLGMLTTCSGRGSRSEPTASMQPYSCADSFSEINGLKMKHSNALQSSVSNKTNFSCNEEIISDKPPLML